MPPTPKGPAAAAGLLIPCLGSVEGETGVRSRDWRPGRIESSEVKSGFSMVPFDVAESFCLKHGGRFWRMRCLPRTLRPQSFRRQR
jgi:hypothetical protein